MATTKNIKKMAREIMSELSDYPADARYEAGDELVRIYKEDEELTSAEAKTLIEALWELGL
jgi:Holliday junction resolvasome RuvABC DNA-binding subunit